MVYSLAPCKYVSLHALGNRILTRDSYRDQRRQYKPIHHLAMQQVHAQVLLQLNKRLQRRVFTQDRLPASSPNTLVTIVESQQLQDGEEQS